LPGEVRAIYPRLDRVPREAWLDLLGSARDEIGVLAFTGLSHADDPEVMALVAARAGAGVRVRFCFAGLDASEGGVSGAGPRGSTVAGQVRSVLAPAPPLAGGGEVLIRVHRAALYQSIYRGDGQLLVAQHAYGVPSGRAPVLHLQCTDDGDMAAAYLDSFEQVWAKASPAP
jgi:hypothetical protein